MTVLSPMTGKPARFLFEQPVMGRFPARYYLDEDTQYIFADSPNWLDAAYDAAIAVTDTGVLARNIANIDRVDWLLSTGPVRLTQGIDLGAGYGMFVRGMRDRGHPFYWHDKYAPNLMARGFEAAEGTYEVAVAFEVLEHLPDPAGFLIDAQKQFGFDTVFLSACLFDENTVPPLDWWYWAFESGQHISFFSLRALHIIGDRLGMRCYRLKGDIYALSRLDWTGHTACPSAFRRLLAGPRRRKSLTFPDHEKMRSHLRTQTRKEPNP